MCLKMLLKMEYLFMEKQKQNEYTKTNYNFRVIYIKILISFQNFQFKKVTL